MRLLLAISTILVSPFAFAAVDWSQPPLACIEDMVPSVASQPCPDLTQVPKPGTDWPDMTPAERAYWTTNRHGMNYCRAEEILRRDRANPGSQGSSAVQIAWMRVNAVRNHDMKVRSLYGGAAAYKIPPHILAGAINQESLFSELGIADDGGNFSCGVAQINLSEWCNWANRQSADKKRQMNWPEKTVNCSVDANKSFIEPFYKLALRRLGSEPAYRLQKVHFENISIDDVNLKPLHYQVSRSFLDNCMVPADAIYAKANELRRLYDNHIPAGMKNSETYAPGEKFQLQCKEQFNSQVYPLQTGWLLAVGQYNAGPRSLDLMASKHKWTKSDLANASTFSGFGPQDLIASLYFAGEYNKRTDRLEAPDLNGNKMEWVWFKQCVLQRHVARVVQHTTAPGSPQLATSLEGSHGCKQSTVDPLTGEIIPGFPGKR